MLVNCQRFGDLFLFGLIWQYSSNHKTSKVQSHIATYLLAAIVNFEPTCIRDAAGFSNPVGLAVMWWA